MDSAILDFLGNHPLMRTLTESQLTRLHGWMEIETLGADTVVFKEYDASRDLYFVLQGEVSLVKWDPEKRDQLSVATLGRGEMFGEMSFVDAAPRALTIKTRMPSRLLKLSYSRMLEEDREVKEIYYKIVSNIAFLCRHRLRQTNQDYVRSLRERINQLRLQNHFGHFFVLWIVLMGFTAVLNTLTVIYDLDAHSPSYTWAYMITALIPFAILIYSFGFSLEDVGVTWKNGRQSIIEGILFSLVSVVGLIAGYAFYASINSSAPSLYYLVVHPPNHPEMFYSVLYLFSSYLQEFIVRGLSQAPLKKFWSTIPHAGIKAILMIAFVFAFAHLPRGMEAAISTFIVGVILGALYDRNQNLLGVGIVHYVWGTVASIYLGVV